MICRSTSLDREGPPEAPGFIVRAPLPASIGSSRCGVMPVRGSTMGKVFGSHLACTGGLSGQLNDPAPFYGARLQVGYYRKSQGVNALIM